MADQQNTKDYVIHPDERAGASGPWLESKLKSERIDLHPHSSLSRALRGLKQLREMVLSKGTTGLRTLDEHFAFFSRGFGADFVTKAIHWGHESGLRLTREQWSQLTGGNPNIASPGDSGTDRNKVWEIVIASIARTFCSSVEFAEPDLVSTFGRIKIAVAAKMAYSEKSIVANLRKGFAQAQNANGAQDIDAYLVFINVVGTYPLIETFKRVAKMNIAGEELTKLLSEEVKIWCERIPLANEAKRLRAKTDKPIGVGFFIPFTLMLSGNPMPFFYVHMPLTWAMESDEYVFAQKFLQASSIALGYPHTSAL